MPKTAVYEYGFLPGGEHQVGAAGQLGVMQSVAVAEAVGYLANNHLGFRIFVPNPPHDFTTSLAIDRIYHYPGYSESLASRG
jgi:hypothetical protein